MNRLKLGLSVAGLACAGVALAAVAQTPPSAPPAAPAHEMTRESARVGAEKLFAAMDVNKDGKLDDADRAAQVGRMFDRLDTNHDGSLSREEFIAAHKPGGRMDHGDRMGAMPMPGGGMGGMHGMRDRAMGMGMMIARNADPQHTGTVTHDAFIASALAIFDKSDLNHDGKVTAEERRAAMAQRGGMGGMGGDMRGMMGHGPDRDDMPPPAN
ncbi:MAG: EF-hand domain-containing protein [Sphingomonadales bacterium]|nr:EF-hand domain-containing protein [Sphingomonadales bacterium]